jgi:hypothetical protein
MVTLKDLILDAKAKADADVQANADLAAKTAAKQAAQEAATAADAASAAATQAMTAAMPEGIPFALDGGQVAVKFDGAVHFGALTDPATVVVTPDPAPGPDLANPPLPADQ